MKIFSSLVSVSLYLFLSVFTVHAETYYVSPSGNDLNLGTSPGKAWKSIAKVSNSTFQPGDSILFLGGSTFSGTLSFDEEDAGTESQPLVISSYGSGKATISSGDSWGLYVYNAAGIKISKLVFAGAGRENNEASGIEFYLDLPETKLQYIHIDSVEVYGYKRMGIVIGSWNGNSGYKGASITNSTVHDCGEAGINTYAQADLGHADFYIAYNTVYDISGLPEVDDHHSGSGIAVGGIDGAIIEYCETYNNGYLNLYEYAGPAGIWGYRCNNLVMQYNESHHNKTGSSKDGGGFDIDGGCTNCTIQYNYSHDNDGPGYLISQYHGAPRMKKVLVRYNISENDVRKNNYGAIHLWSSGSNGGIEDVGIYNNTIYLTATPDGNPKMVYLQNANMYNVRFRNNIFFVSGGLDMIYMDKSMDVRFENNNYWTSGGRFRVRWGQTTYNSYDNWQKATGQETYKGKVIGLVMDPQLQDPGKGITISEPGMLHTLSGYQLKATSELIDKGLDQQQEWGIDIGDRDFWGNSLHQRSQLSVGAHQYQGNSGTRLCLYGGKVPLNFGTAAGGTYSGPGITEGKYFDPEIAGLGHHELKYTYIDDSGETKKVQHTITVINAKATAWKGLENKSEDWFNSQNWTTCVPTAQIDATIRVNPAQSSMKGAFPEISKGAYAEVKNLKTNDVLQVKGEGTLEINGGFNGKGIEAEQGMTVVFKSNAKQQIPAGKYSKLVLQGTKEKELSGAVAVGNELALGAGKLLLDDHTLTLGSEGIISNVSEAAYVVADGKGSLVVEAVGNGRPGVFPLGTAESYTPATIENKGEVDDFSMRITPAVLSKGTHGNELTNEWVNRTWHLEEKQAGGSDVSMQLQWRTADQQEAFVPTSAFVSQYVKDEWSAPGEHAAYTETIEEGLYRISLHHINNFTSFAIGIRDGILPVSYTYFTVEAIGGEALLRWETSTEKDNKGFRVEVSEDGVNFRQLGFVASKQSTSERPQQYSFRDLEAGKEGSRYYRLVQEDANGTTTTSTVISVNFSLEGKEVLVKQNPFQKSIELQLEASQEATLILKLSDLRGEFIRSKEYAVQKGANAVEFKTPDNLPAGLYLLSIELGEKVYQLKVVKQ